MAARKTKDTAYIVVDLGYGDSGKGSIVDFLARTRRCRTVVRFNGGGQAGHNVVTADGRHHTFSHFGSASFVPGTLTYLSRFMVVSPLAMLAEAERLLTLGVAGILSRTIVSEAALVVTPYERAVNRLRELARGDGRHGSCGMGIGETVSDAIRAPEDAVRMRDLSDPAVLKAKLERMRSRKLSEAAEIIGRCRGLEAAREEITVLGSDGVAGRFAELAAPLAGLVRLDDGRLLRRALSGGNVIFEGAQGVLLDEIRGFHPYTTWSNCTFGNALTLLGEAGHSGRTVKLGLIRAYATRHGPGPFVTEDAGLTAALPDRHNRLDAWQRDFRVGWLDLAALRYAVAVCGGIDALAVSCLDRLRDQRFWAVADSYELPDGASTEAARRLIAGPEAANRWRGIRPSEGKDLAHQQAITDLLMAAAPVLDASATERSFARRWRRHLERITAALDAPAAIASFGPTAEDKTLLPGCVL